MKTLGLSFSIGLGLAGIFVCEDESSPARSAGDLAGLLCLWPFEGVTAFWAVDQLHLERFPGKSRVLETDANSKS